MSQIPESWDLGSDVEISDASMKEFYPWGLNYDGDYENFKHHLLSNNISMWKSIKTASEIAFEYSAENNILFDFIIRMRFDVIPSISIDKLVMQIPNNGILVPDTNQPKDMVNDWFAAGRPREMKIYMNLFDSIREIFLDTQSNHGVWCNELGLALHLEQSQIKIRKIDMGMLFR